MRHYGYDRQERGEEPEYQVEQKPYFRTRLYHREPQRPGRHGDTTQLRVSSFTHPTDPHSSTHTTPPTRLLIFPLLELNVFTISTTAGKQSTRLHGC
jgi:hypothetical protein